jgi:hypothetical protein
MNRTRFRVWRTCRFRNLVVLEAVAQGELMNRSTKSRGTLILLAMVLGWTMISPDVSAQSSPGKPQVSSAAGVKSPYAARARSYGQNRMTPKAREYYTLRWGVDSLNVRSVESGEIIRFTYRVLDPEKAQPLNEKRNEPSLIDPKAGVKLVIPSLEKVGKLRQSSSPEAGKVYWMAFSNKGGAVKRGDRVNLLIGSFQANGLTVE